MSSISVQITADVADLTAKLAVAKAEVSSANVELRDLAQQMAAAGNAASSELKSGLASAAQSAATARAEMAALNAQMKETRAGSSGLAASFTGMRESIESTMAPIGALNSLITAFGEVFLVAFAGERIVSGIEHVAELGAELVKLNEQTGVAIETLSGWHYAAEQVDVSAESLDSGIKKLGKSIQEALSNPASKANEAFATMGISQEYLRQHSNDLQAVFMKMADSFHDHADGANADAIAMATLGRGGVEMIPILREGSAAIEAQIEKQKALGSQMTGPMAEAMLKHRQAVKDLGNAWSAFGIEFTNFVAGPATVVSNWLTTFFVDMGKGIDRLKGNWIDFEGTVANSPMGGALAGTRKWDTPAAGAAKPAFGNLTKPDKLSGKDLTGFTDADLNKAIPAHESGMSKFDQRYWEILTKESKDLSASIAADAAKTDADLKKLADDNFQNFRSSIEEQKDAAKGNFDEQLRLDQQLIDRARELYGQDNTHFREAMRARFADLRAQVDQQMQPWDNLVHGIGNSFQTMFNGVLQGTQTFHQMMANMASNLLATFAQMEMKAVESWALSEIRKTLVTRQGEAARTGITSAAIATDNAGFLVRAGRWIASELGMTAATTAGETERTTAKIAAEAAGKAAEIAANVTAVESYAAVAAAGAAAAVASIPYVGPAMAVAASAQTFAMLQPYAVIASAAGGFDVGPGQTPLTQLHSSEMVLPASLAEGIRAMVADRQTGAGGGDVVHVHISAIDSADVERWAKSNARTLAQAVSGHQRLNPSTRGNF